YLGVGPTLNAPPPVLVARDADREMPQVTPVVAHITEKTALDDARGGLMPDLRGFSAREAIRTLSQIGMTSRMSGDGFVVTQSPAAGEALVLGGVCSLRLNRRPPPTDTGGAPQ